MMGSKTLLALAAGVLLFVSGCAATKYGAVKIDSVPAGAEVVNLKDNSNLGVTPVKVSFPGTADTAEYVTIQVRKPGYMDRITSFWVNKRHQTAAAAENSAVDVQVELEKK